MYSCYFNILFRKSAYYNFIIKLTDTNNTNNLIYYNKEVTNEIYHFPG